MQLWMVLSTLAVGCMKCSWYFSMFAAVYSPNSRFLLKGLKVSLANPQTKWRFRPRKIIEAERRNSCGRSPRHRGTRGMAMFQEKIQRKMVIFDLDIGGLATEIWLCPAQAPLLNHQISSKVGILAQQGLEFDPLRCLVLIMIFVRRNELQSLESTPGCPEIVLFFYFFFGFTIDVAARVCWLHCYTI